MKILIIDDEKNMRRILGDYLKNEGFDVIDAVDGEDGIEKILHHKDFDLVLLDVRMPKMDGFLVIKEIKEISEVPVIFLTAMDDSYDEVKGLELGAEDYITKPFSYNVLMARVKHCLKKYHRTDRNQIVYEDMVLDIDNKEAYIDKESLHLTIKEFELLTYLIEHKNQNLQREVILNRIWGYDYYGDPRTLDTHIKTLRGKLGNIGTCIKTIRGVGYGFKSDSEKKKNHI